MPHLLKSFFGLSGCQFRHFIPSLIFLVQLDRCLTVFNKHSCHGGISIYRILNSFLFLFVAWIVCFLSFLQEKFLFTSQVAQCSLCLDLFFMQAALASIHLMTSGCGAHCRFAVSTHRKWRKVLIQSSHHCILCWLCVRARCRMLQDMDHVGASCALLPRLVCVIYLNTAKVVLWPWLH